MTTVSANVRSVGRPIKKDNFKLIELMGDGVSEECSTEARRILDTVFKATGKKCSWERHPIGGRCILLHGVPITDATLEACKKSDGVFLGAVNDPRFDKLPVDKRPEKGLLRIRTELNAYQNIHPVYVAPELADASSIREDIVKGTDFVIMRELCGDIYTYHHELHDSYAKDIMHYSVPEIERIARAAGHLARKRKKFVTSVGKWNVLACSQLWKRVVDEVFAKEFPDIKLEHQLVDSAAFKILKNPRAYDVILMPNMFGDILSDEAAALMASLGMLSSASISDPGMPGFYEPAHGSAPDIAGKNICNPYGSILSAAMMLRYQFEMDREADVVERACYQAIREGYVTPDIARGKKPKGTKECGKCVAELVKRELSGKRRSRL